MYSFVYVEYRDRLAYTLGLSLELGFGNQGDQGWCRGERALHTYSPGVCECNWPCWASFALLHTISIDNTFASVCRWINVSVLRLAFWSSYLAKNAMPRARL